MKQTEIIMGMPVTIEVLDAQITASDFKKIFDYFRQIDEQFSTYKSTSEISKINAGEIQLEDASPAMQEIFELSDLTKRQTNGYFDIFYEGNYDPSGLVKGWAIWQASKLLKELGAENFYLDVGSDIQTSGSNAGRMWSVGIKNPFKQEEIVKIIYPQDQGVATSGNYIRGDHIYSPHGNNPSDELVSLTVIGPNIYEADRFATGAFAMGKNGIEFIEKLPGFEGYAIDKKGIATFTSGFEKYTNA